MACGSFLFILIEEVHILDVSNPLLNAEQRWNLLILGANMILLGSLLAVESENNSVVPTQFFWQDHQGLSC